MHKILLFSLILSLGLLSSAGLEAASDKPKRGGTLTMGIYRDLALLNPLVATRSIDGDLRTLAFETLVGLDAKNHLQPNLAQSWKVSKDGRLYTFSLRKGVKFHDGREMTAEDVKFSMDYTMNPQNGAFGFNKLELVDRVEAFEKYILLVHLKRPSPALLSSLAQITTFSVVPKGSLKDGTDKPVRYPPGTGPFKFVEWQPKHRVVFERFEDYWGSKAWIDRLVLIPITDDSTRFTALRVGDVDIIERTPREWVRQVIDNNIKGIDYAKASSSSFRRIIFNVAAPPFDNKKLRQAVAHALDKKEMLQAAYFGFGEPNDQKYRKGDSWYIEGVTPPTYDLARARTFLKEAGYNGEPIEIIVIQSATEQAEATTLQAQLKKVGIPLRLVVMEAGAANSRFRRGDFTLRFAGTSSYTDPSPTYGTGLFCEPDRQKRATNASGYCDKEMDSMLQKAEAELDVAKRKELFRQILGKLLDDLPEIYIGFVPEFFTFREHVRGFTTDDDGHFHWWGGGLNSTWLK